MWRLTLHVSEGSSTLSSSMRSNRALHRRGMMPWFSADPIIVYDLPDPAEWNTKLDRPFSFLSSSLKHTIRFNLRLASPLRSLARYGGMEIIEWRYPVRYWVIETMDDIVPAPTRLIPPLDVGRTPMSETWLPSIAHLVKYTFFIIQHRIINETDRSHYVERLVIEFQIETATPTTATRNKRWRSGFYGGLTCDWSAWPYRLAAAENLFYGRAWPLDMLWVSTLHPIESSS